MNHRTALAAWDRFDKRASGTWGSQVREVSQQFIKEIGDLLKNYLNKAGITSIQVRTQGLGTRVTGVTSEGLAVEVNAHFTIQDRVKYVISVDGDRIEQFIEVHYETSSNMAARIHNDLVRTLRIYG